MRKILMLHGAIGSSQQFLSLADELKNDFEIHMLNFSGHGGIALPSEPFSIKLFAGDVLKWLDENKINTIDIFGYSMGGYVALYLARYSPSRVGKIFTLATKFEWNKLAAGKESKMLIPEKIEEKIPAFAKTLEQRHFPVDWKVVLQTQRQ